MTKRTIRTVRHTPDSHHENPEYRIPAVDPGESTGDPEADVITFKEPKDLTKARVGKKRPKKKKK